MPPRISIHPWSTDFMSVWDRREGSDRIFWEEIGVRNHMVIMAWAILIEGRKVTGLFFGRASCIMGDFCISAHVIRAPNSVTKRASSLAGRERIGSGRGVISNQFIVAPPIIAPKVSHMAGEVKSLEIFDTLWMGLLQWGDQILAIIRRTEYAEVRRVAIKNIKIIKWFVGEKRVNSRIRSFE